MPRDDGGGNLLDALAHPAQVNLLGAYEGANQIARGIWANRRNQADQLAGEAFQGSLNPDGTPNQSQLNINLRNAGPNAALAAQDSSQKGQTLDTGTFATHMARLTSLSGAAMALAAQYPNGVPQEAANAEIDQQASRLGLSPADVARAKAQFGNDPAANTATIFRNHAANLSAQQQLMATRPGVTTIDNGQAVTGATVGAPLSNQPGAVTPTGSSTPTGYPTRQQLLEQVGRPVTDPDEAKRYGVPVGTVLTEPIIKRYIEQGGGHLVGPAGAPATPPTPSPIPGGGVYRPRGAPAPAPGAPPGAAQPPAAPTATPSPQAPPTATPASEQSPAEPPYKGVVTSMPPGTEEEVKQYAADRSAIPSLQTGVVNLRTAKEALALTRSGPGTESTHRMYAFLVAQGIQPGFKDNGDIENWYVARKAMNAFVSGQAGKAGTDLGLGLQEASNANMEINQAAANHVLNQQIGLQNQRIAMNLEAPKGGVGYGEHGQTFTTKTTDPRGFAWDAYSPAERQVIISDAKKSKDGYEKLVRSVELGIKHGLVHVPVAQAATPAPAPAAAPAPKPNLLVPTN